MPTTLLHELADLSKQEPSNAIARRWLVLAAFAIGGSLSYGASLALVLPGWEIAKAALWLALSAGLAWCVFVPALRAGTGVSWRECCESSLLTMAFGEVALISGVLVNATLWRLGLTGHAVAINALIVALSNVVMAAMLATLLRGRGVAPQRTIGLWLLALNGSGAVLFFAFFQLLHAR